MLYIFARMSTLKGGDVKKKNDISLAVKTAEVPLPD